jgi:GNAT superfamily N-acetyltransferase
VAVDQGDGAYVGMTSLIYNQVDPAIANTDLTGVVRGYRRQGIATALKVHAISAAKAQGVRRIDTMNNETNPMLELNVRLGFKPGPAWRYYEKVL